MGLFSSMTLNSLNDLFVAQIEDLYDAEQRLTKALPKMAEAASSPPLRSAFEKHLRETQQHVARLEKVFGTIGVTPQRETCEAMKGLIAEGDEAVSATGEPSVKDAALIAAAQRVEHYEIAGYGTVRTLAEQLGRPEVARILAADPGRGRGLRQEVDRDRRVVRQRQRLAVVSLLGGERPGLRRWRAPHEGCDQAIPQTASRPGTRTDLNLAAFGAEGLSRPGTRPASMSEPPQG